MNGRRASLWQHRDFLALWAAQAVSALGSRITRTALPVIAVLAVDGSPTELGLLAALSVAPGALVGLFAGGPIDRSRKRPILIGVDLLRAALVATIPIAAWLGALSMLQLYAVAAAVGAASSLFQIADNTYLPTLVASEALTEANAKLETTESAAEIAGPGLAGILIDVLSAPVTLVVDAATYVVSALFLSAIRSQEETVAAEDADAPPPGWRRDLHIGWRACLDHEIVRPLLLISAVQTLTFGFLFALYMLYTLDTLGLSAGAVGVIISAGGVGALFGALLARRLGERWGRGPTLLISAAGAQLALLLVPAASDANALGIGLLVAQQILGDAFLMAFTIHAVSLRQSVLPQAVLGRANAVFQTVASALLPLGALLAGLLGEALGVRTALWLGVGIGLTAPLFSWRLRQLREPSGSARSEKLDSQAPS